MARIGTVVFGLVLLLSGSSISAQAPTTTASQAEQVSIQGEVNKPGTFEFVKDMTVAELVAAAGGFTTAADLSRVVIVTKNLPNGQTNKLGKPISMYVDYGKLLLLKDKEAAMKMLKLHAGDRVIVRKPR